MTNHSSITLPYPKALYFFEYILLKEYSKELDFKRNILTILNKTHQVQLKFNFPLILNLNEEIKIDKNLLDDLINKPPNFLILLIQAGNAALGFYNHGHLTHHKVIRKYMVRKKQGKAQLSYLKTKGKSRAGSRIRLSNTVKFFEEINHNLIQWSNAEKIDTLIYSCTPLSWGMLHRSNVKIPFLKKDKRLKKLPLSIGKPNFEILKKAANYCQKGYIEILPGCEEKYLLEIKSFFNLYTENNK